MVVPPSTGSIAPMAAVATATPGTGSPASSGTPSANAKAKANASMSAPGTLNGPPSGNNHAIPLSARRAEPLDLKTVERRGQPNLPPEVPKKNRLFGIPEAPSFFPTEEEFKDPMEYMRKITPEGRKYGIIKVVPPEGWNPTFAINTERFHFRTRRQELNSVEGGNRVNNDYLDQLARFHKQNGHNLNRFPSVDKRPLDLYRLKKTVERKGGFEQVCKGKRWAEVGRDLGYSGKIMSSLSTSLKNSYQKWLLPYEEYLRLAKPGVHQQLELANGGPYTPSPGPSPAKKLQAATPSMNETSPTMHAHVALHASINDNSTPQPPSLSRENSQSSAPLPPPPANPTGGFTAVNVGGFTAVNHAPPPTSSFTSVNIANGFHSNSATPQPVVQTTTQTNGHTTMTPHHQGLPSLKRQHSDQVLTQDEIDAMNRRSKRLRKDVPTVAGSNMHHSSHARMSAGPGSSRKGRPDIRPGEACENCCKPDDRPKMVVCETCDGAYHRYCLEPPLKQLPEHEWHCPKCLVGTNEYGFEEGDVYSLVGFQRRAAEFKTMHFNNIPRQFNPLNEHKRIPDEDDVEREFWRLVDELSDTTEVEYGADIHSTTHGSGFPTIEKNPRDPYSVDPWNLNMLPLDKESLFRHIKSDVSGMTVPWLYVGMIFSTFCWHNEDHFTYSANYQHFGATKTWYGVPGDDAYKFEDAMKEEVPELFETQPDLLFQLVTLARPEKLRKAGVRVYAIDQRAGQFVITYPRAYHAGFNHGFNFNEAVNFAPHDWEPFGEEGVKRLRNYRKQPCFSHDEMLLTAASRENNIKTAKWLAPALERMRDDEIAARKHFLESPEADGNSGVIEASPYVGPRYKAEPEAMIATTGNDDEEVICSFCKAYCFLSNYRCKKTNKNLCLLHAGSYECCDATEAERYSGENGEHVLQYRMTDDVLLSTVKKVADKANVPGNWAARVDAELEDTMRPDLRRLRTLLSEGEKIQYDLPQLPDLKKFVERCNDWVEEATSYITRKQQNRRKNEKAWRKGTQKQAEMEERDKELRSVEKIRTLLASADKIGFDCPEIQTLRERSDAISEFQRDANAALHSIRSRSTADFEELVERGKEFHVDIPEMDDLERVVKRLKWDDLAKIKRPNPETRRQEQTLKDIERFIQEGVDIGVPDTNGDMMFFREHKAQAELWEQKAKELMAVEQVHYQQLDSLSAQAVTLPVSAETLAAVEAILKKQREVQEKIVSLVEQSRNIDFRQRPYYKEMRQVMDALEELQSKPAGTIELEKLQKVHEDWMREGKKLFGKANAPLHILLQHMLIVDERNQACFDLRDKPRMPVEPQSREASPEESEGHQIPTDGSTSSRDVFCICRKPEAGMMIECEICHEWYHGKCLKIARGKVKEDDKYTCPICDWRVKIPRDAARPKLEELQAWQDKLDTLPFQPEEEKVLNSICETGQAFRDFMRPYIHPAVPTTQEEIGTIRFHLRKIEGADILLADETNFLRTELHKWCPIAPAPPPMIQMSGSTRKPRPTKQQKLMAQLGITNPDDLPQQYKIKPHIAKRKATEAMGGKAQPLQPAGASISPTGSQPASLPGSSSGLGQTPGSANKPFLTPLAIQVLGPLAGAPVVSQVLSAEPHMNSEKLAKMKAILEQQPNTRDIGGEEMRRKIANFTPIGMHEYGISNRNSPAVTTTYRDAPMFATSTDTSQFNMSQQQANGLGSPAQYSPAGFTGPSPPNPTFETSIFDSNDGNQDGMFNEPAAEAKSGNMFDSPKPAPGNPFGGGAGINSPGFGGSQQSAGGIDNVFDDLIGGFDGAGETKDAQKQCATSTSTATKTDVEMKDAPATAPEMDGQQTSQRQDSADEHDAASEKIIMDDFVQ
ncbi:Multicopy suppressor of chk1 protein 1 [Teratosphaeria destructans]|uniref:Multicopy suppressor of chk1 protein 1 n=1 Tax=Teratosphaeria destructans TaxID=418781 RepID=A0A9W7W715_9PEZI|nr:Multicopy suppressor of chk1 protein 1 [Teratosphaeria destructans]